MSPQGHNSHALQFQALSSPWCHDCAIGPGPFFSFSLSSLCSFPCPLSVIVLTFSTQTLQAVPLHTTTPCFCALKAVHLHSWLHVYDSVCVPLYVIGCAPFYYKYPVVAIVRTLALYLFTFCESIPSTSF